MDAIITVKALDKVYENGFQALKNVDLEIKRGEILALLGPNGAGKTTLISAITGIVSPSSGQVLVDGNDNITQYKATRRLIGLVPQELTIGAFETVWNTVRFSRGLFGKKSDNAYLKQLLKDLSLWDKKDNQLRMLSGGMKRRVLIAKALSHQPNILFLDEPTAGVDVELRKDMWRLVAQLRKSGVTIILTTHYIEEAEEIADRIGIINHGELVLVENKAELMKKLGKKQLVVELKQSMQKVPSTLKSFDIHMNEARDKLTYTYDSSADATGITRVLNGLSDSNIQLKEVKTTQSSLEDIFVNLVKNSDNAA